MLTAIAFTVAVGFGVQAPAIPFFARELGVGSAAVGGIVSAFAFMRLVTGPVGGRLVDRLGERRVLVTGVFLVAMTSVLAGFAQNFPQLLVLRGAGGVGSAMYTVSAMSLLLRVTPAAHRGRAVGMFQGSFYTGTVSGPALGGLLTGMSPRVPFVLYGLAMAGAGLIGVGLLSRTGSLVEGTGAEADRMRLGAAFRLRPYRAVLATNFSIGWTVYGVRVSVLPMFLLDVLRGSAGWVGVGLTTCALAQALALPPAGRQADRWPGRRSLIVGESIMIAALLVVILPGTLPAYVVGLALLGLGAAMLTTAGAKTVGDLTGGNGGTVIAIYQMAADTGMAIGPFAAGYLAETFSYSAALSVTLAVLLAGLVMSLLIRRP